MIALFTIVNVLFGVGVEGFVIAIGYYLVFLYKISLCSACIDIYFIIEYFV
ncbi:protein of unknown function [Tepidibacter aestuarii]|nr:protein of unknown function [Tepidibacter aestuarii]